MKKYNVYIRDAGRFAFVQVDGHTVEVDLENHLLVFYNDEKKVSAFFRMPEIIGFELSTT